MDRQMQIVQQNMLDEQTGQPVPVVSVAISGDIKELLDAIARLEPSYASYRHMVGAALGEGLAVLLARAKENQSGGERKSEPHH